MTTPKQRFIIEEKEKRMDMKNSGIEGAPLDIGELESLPFPLDTEMDTFKFDLAMLGGPEPTAAELEDIKSIEMACRR